MNILLTNEGQTKALGYRLVTESMKPWKTLALLGDLGSGKTTLVQGVIEALGGLGSDVHSPSYVLEHEYLVTDGVVVHRDAWRGDAGEDDSASPVCVRLIIEWPERAQDKYWPTPVLEVRLDHHAEGRIASFADGFL